MLLRGDGRRFSANKLHHENKVGNHLPRPDLHGKGIHEQDISSFCTSAISIFSPGVQETVCVQK